MTVPSRSQSAADRTRPATTAAPCGLAGVRHAPTRRCWLVGPRRPGGPALIGSGVATHKIGSGIVTPERHPEVLPVTRRVRPGHRAELRTALMCCWLEPAQSGRPVDLRRPTPGGTPPDARGLCRRRAGSGTRPGATPAGGCDPSPARPPARGRCGTSSSWAPAPPSTAPAAPPRVAEAAPPEQRALAGSATAAGGDQPVQSTAARLGDSPRSCSVRFSSSATPLFRTPAAPTAGPARSGPCP
jgi:hypothetical protein